MRKLISLLCIFLLLEGVCCASSDDSKSKTRKVTTIMGPPPASMVNINEIVLSKIERRVFGRNFVGDYPINRLTRLEQRVFGAVQSGDVNNRLRRLQTATHNYKNSYTAANNTYPYPYNNYFNRPYDPYYNNPQRTSGIKNFLNSFASGTLTGFSPPVTPATTYYNTQSGYNSPYSGYQTQSWNSNNMFSNGGNGSETYYDDGRYRKDLSSTGGGCGVQIVY